MRRLIPWILAGAVLGASSPAGAKDITGRFGVGGDSTLGFRSGLEGPVTGVSGAYGVSPELILRGILFFSVFSPDMGDSQTDFQLAAGLSYQFISSDRVNVGFGGDLVLGVRDAGESATQIGIAAPLRTEIFITDHLAVHADIGVTLTLVPEEGSVFGPMGTADGTAIGLFDNADLLGAAGFTFWF